MSQTEQDAESEPSFDDEWEYDAYRMGRATRTKEVKGGDVWLNPPWSSNGDGAAKHQWLRKARSETNRDAVDSVTVLLPCDTSAHWFHTHVLRAEAVCLVGPGRIPFIGEDRNPSFELVIAAFGDVDDDLVAALNELGAVIYGKSIHEETIQTSLGAVERRAES